VNGRKKGDIFGRYTCHNWNGSSVVDYFLTPLSFVDRVSYFSVGDFIPWLSDHCIIKAKILLMDKYAGTATSEETSEVHPGFLWNETSISNYRTSLQGGVMEGKVRDLINSSTPSTTDLADKICKLMLENASSADIKVKKNRTEILGDPWFDNECKFEKENLNSLSKKLSKSPSDQKIRRKVFEAKKNFKKIILAKKRRHRKTLTDELQNKKQDGNLKDFWKIFRKISPKNKSDPRQPSMTDFRKYFENLSKSGRAQDTPSLSHADGPLDFAITSEELVDASKRMKYGKAHGTDIVCNEMIFALANSYPKLVLRLFNNILQTSEIIPAWITGLIVPIHKDGPKLDPGNYRGITLMSCLGKLFLSILNARLMVYALDKKILSCNQLGFVSGNRTSDAHIIINNMVNKLCHKSNKKIFSCFVDFRKAFDLVPRDTLLKKLMKYGINGKFFNIIRNIYTNDKACIKLNGKCSAPFDIDIGVRQGCILSPLLFNIFLSDLAKSLHDIKFPAVGNINSLFWADDLVMFSDSEEGLQKMLNVLEIYCKDNELTVNTKKTKCMIFNKTGRLILRAFYLNNVQLECVRDYKYLGFIITPSGEINTGLKDLRDRAFRAFMKVKRDLGESFNQDVSLILSLIDSLIKPILLYASDFWGCFNLPKSNPIENMYMSMLKQVLGVQKQTTNDGVLLELGRVPIVYEAKRLSIKNWERIIRGKGNEPLLDSFKDSLNLNLPWTIQIKSNLENIGLSNFYMRNYSSKGPYVFKKLFQRLCDIFHQETFEKIRGNRSKLRTYAIFKKEIGFEKYLSDVKNVSMRTKVTKFRLSNHKLMIESGRHKGIKNPDERFCPFCPEVVENEFHFLFNCPIYHIPRERFINPITNIIYNFQALPGEQKLQLVMSCMDQDLCSFISNSMDIRDFLINKPKRCM
jgi:hypothetical protein